MVPRLTSRWLAVPVAVALVAIGLPAVWAPPAGAEVTFTSTAVAQHSGLCLDVPSDSTANNIQLAQATCDQGASQRLTFTPVAGVANTYTVSPGHTAGKCMDVYGVSTADLARIVQWTCLSVQQNQQFRLEVVSAANETFRLVARHSSKCVDVNGAWRGRLELLQALIGRLGNGWKPPPVSPGV